MIPLRLFLLSLLLPSILSDIAADRAALIRLRDTVRGRTYAWNASSPTPCSWDGVVCDNITNRVIELRLPGDGLAGELPSGTFGNLTELRALSLRNNSLLGELPSDLAACTQLHGLHLNGNRFSGKIPDWIFGMVNLRHINFGGNRFSGNISSEFNRLINLRTLYLEHNQFTGNLPDFHAPIGLLRFNVSYNQLTGRIPPRLSIVFNQTSFLGTSLCGLPLGLCPDDEVHRGDHLSGGAIAGIVVGTIIILLLILLISFLLWRKLKTRKIQPQIPPSTPTPASTKNPQIHSDPENPNLDITPIEPKETPKTSISNRSSDGLTFFGDDVEPFTLGQLLKASAELIGKGTVGSTYKAYFDSGVEVIVKRLKNVRLSEEDFDAKIEEIGSLVHSHLEPLRGYFYGKEEKLLLFEPIPQGSLHALLHGSNKQGPVSWKIRAKIALGAARGIAYLHSISPETSHGNIKSSNVFLTDYYNARVSEYGLTQLVSSISTLNGYRAPEVGDTSQVSQAADVYSFGVLIMELVSGKVPDKALTEEGIELPNWVESVGPHKWKEVLFDTHLEWFDSAEVEEIVQFVNLSVACAGRSPDRRPPMAEVVGRIEEICG